MGKIVISALRPNGTVEVSCLVTGCGLAWWVDPLDQRLLSGHRWDCGRDHGAARRIGSLNAWLHLRHGIQERGSGGGGGGCGEGACKPFAWHFYRDVRDLSRPNGLLLDRDAKEVRSSAEALSLIEWDTSVWPDEARSSGILESGVPRKPAPGMIRWVGYRDCGAGGNTIGGHRRYTFATCARCGHDIYVDVYQPGRQARGHISGLGCGEMPEPSWMAGHAPLYCEEVLSTSVYAPQPCVLAAGEEMRRFEETLGARWTWWTSGYIGEPAYAVFCGEDGVFGLGIIRETAGRLACNLTWGTPRGLLAMLPSVDGPWELRGALTLLAGAS